MFVIFHDIEWLTDENNSWLKAINEVKESDSSGETVSYSAKQTTVEDLKKDPQMAKLPLAVLQAIAKKASQGGSFVRQPEKSKDDGAKPKSYTAESVRSIFRTLYAKANRYNIFILVTTSVLDPVNKAVIDKLDANNKNIAKQSYSVYGSQKEMETGKRDESANHQTLFVCPSESKVRLFDYSPSGNFAWWNDFLKDLRR